MKVSIFLNMQNHQIISTHLQNVSLFCVSATALICYDLLVIITPDSGTRAVRMKFITRLRCDGVLYFTEDGNTSACLALIATCDI